MRDRVILESKIWLKGQHRLFEEPFVLGLTLTELVLLSKLDLREATIDLHRSIWAPDVSKFSLKEITNIPINTWIVGTKYIFVPIQSTRLAAGEQKHFVLTSEATGQVYAALIGQAEIRRK